MDTQAFVNTIDGVAGRRQVDSSAAKFLNLHLGARDPEQGKKKLFFANPWAIAFTRPSGAGAAYVVSAASNLLVKVNVAANGTLSNTVDADTTRYIDLADPAAVIVANLRKTNHSRSVVFDATLINHEGHHRHEAGPTGLTVVSFVPFVVIQRRYRQLKTEYAPRHYRPARSGRTSSSRPRPAIRPSGPNTTPASRSTSARNWPTTWPTT